MIVGTLDGIFVSTDDGKSRKTTQKGNCTGLTSIGNIVFASFENAYSEVATAYTLDNGLTWKFSDDGLPKQINVRAITSDKEYVYIGSGDGVVWKRKLSDFGITSVEETTIVDDFDISPNPINENSKLKWKMNNSGNVSINLYNELGREVATLLDNYRNSGYNEI